MQNHCLKKLTCISRIHEPVRVEECPGERGGGVADGDGGGEVLLVDGADVGGDERHGPDAQADGLAAKVVRLRRDLEHVLHARVQVGHQHGHGGGILG